MQYNHYKANHSYFSFRVALRYHPVHRINTEEGFQLVYVVIVFVNNINASIITLREERCIIGAVYNIAEAGHIFYLAGC